MMQNGEITESVTFTDRKTRLVVFGILQIILGGLSLLLIMLSMASMIMLTVSGKANDSVSIGRMIPGILFYLLLACWFVTMGIGSIRAKRWARALILISSWFWLVCGICGLVFMLTTIMPNMYKQIAGEEQMPFVAIVAMVCVMAAFMSIFYVVIPLLLVLFYKGKDVKATCEYRNPEICWTDKCPISVLGMSLICASWAASMLFMSVYNWTIPFFGIVLSGTNGAIVVLALMSMIGYAGWGIYRLDIKAWWLALLIFAGWFVSTLITFAHVNMQDYYDKMGFTEKQVEQISQYGYMWGHGMRIFMGIWLVAVVVYLVYIKKYFRADLQQDNSRQDAKARRILDTDLKK